MNFHLNIFANRLLISWFIKKFTASNPSQDFSTEMGSWHPGYLDFQTVTNFSNVKLSPACGLNLRSSVLKTNASLNSLHSYNNNLKVIVIFLVHPPGLSNLLLVTVQQCFIAHTPGLYFSTTVISSYRRNSSDWQDRKFFLRKRVVSEIVPNDYFFPKRFRNEKWFHFLPQPPVCWRKKWRKFCQKFWLFLSCAGGYGDTTTPTKEDFGDIQSIVGLNLSYWKKVGHSWKCKYAQVELEGARVTSQRRLNFRASQAVHRADDVTALNFLSQVNSMNA